VTASELSSRGGRARSHGTHGSARVHLDREVRSGATGHVAAPETTSAGRCGPKLQLAWQRVDARPARCLDLELVCGGTWSSGCRQYSFPHRGSLRGREVFNKAELLYPKALISALIPNKLPRHHIRVKISNMVRLAFDRQKADQSKSRVSRAQHPPANSTKCFKRNGAPKGYGLDTSRKQKSNHFRRNGAPKRLGARYLVEVKSKPF
jgi:hypothetical protein